MRDSHHYAIAKKNAKEVIIEIAGRLDTITAPALEKAINDSIQDEQHPVLDIKELEYISGAGLCVLPSAQKIGSMKVKNVCGEIMESFEMTGFVEVLVME